MARGKKPEVYHFRRSRGLARVSELRAFASWIGKRLGFNITADGLDIQETHDGIALRISSVLDHPFRVRLVDGGVVVGFGRIYVNDTNLTTFPIANLETLLAVEGACYIVLEIAFGTWPQIATASIGVATSAPNRMEVNGSQVQTVSRTIIAVVEEDEYGLVVRQVVRDDLKMRQYTDAAIVVSHPWSL